MSNEVSRDKIHLPVSLQKCGFISLTNAGAGEYESPRVESNFVNMYTTVLLIHTLFGAERKKDNLAVSIV